MKRLWVEGLQPLRHPSPVLSAVFSLDGRWIATGSHDGWVRVWDATTGQARFSLRAHKDHVGWVAFSPDGRRLATASWDKTAGLWDFDPQRAGAEISLLHTLTAHQDQVGCVTFSPDSQRLASAGEDQIV